jgi:hypothetical protein
LAAEAMCEEGHSWKLVSSQEKPVEFGNKDNLSRADQEALRSIRDNKLHYLLHYLIAEEQELLSAAAEKSLVTILPKASQGVVNWAIGALAAMAPCVEIQIRKC